MSLTIVRKEGGRVPGGKLKIEIPDLSIRGRVNLYRFVSSSDSKIICFYLLYVIFSEMHVLALFENKAENFPSSVRIPSSTKDFFLLFFFL